jgi:Mrp family chromosome partitioning ATPase
LLQLLLRAVKIGLSEKQLSTSHSKLFHQTKKLSIGIRIVSNTHPGSTTMKRGTMETSKPKGMNLSNIPSASVVSVFKHKGGVGKTTLTWQLSRHI